MVKLRVFMTLIKVSSGSHISLPFPLLPSLLIRDLAFPLDTLQSPREQKTVAQT